MKYAAEQFTPQVISEMIPLCQVHYDEVGPFQFDLDIDWDRFIVMQNMGCAYLFTAREEGELVGYAIYLVNTHTHFAETIIAGQDALYLKPEYRGKGFGAELVMFCEASLSEFCHAITQSVTPEFEYEKMLLQNGYAPLEKLYVKKLMRVN